MHERQGVARLGEVAQRGLVVVEGEAELLEVVGTTHPRRRLADLLHRGEQQADEDRDDGDDDEQFNQGECSLLAHGVYLHRLVQTFAGSAWSRVRRTVFGFGHFPPASWRYSMYRAVATAASLPSSFSTT